MKNLWAYLAMAAVCLMAALFALYTGMSLLYTGAEAAVTPYPAPSRPPVRIVIPDAAEPENPGPDIPAEQPGTAAEAWLPEGGRVLFVGNSLVQGLRSACADGGHSFICRKGLSLTGLMYILPDGSGADCDIAVIEMGSNELGLWSEDDFKASYAEALDRIACPAVCLSVPPVCGAKSRYGARVNNSNAAECSGWIRDACWDRDDAVYLDCSGFFGDALDPGMTGDGLHLTAEAYSDWYGWIMSELLLERPVE